MKPHKLGLKIKLRGICQQVVTKHLETEIIVLLWGSYDDSFRIIYVWQKHAHLSEHMVVGESPPTVKGLWDRIIFGLPNQSTLYYSKRMTVQAIEQLFQITVLAKGAFVEPGGGTLIGSEILPKCLGCQRLCLFLTLENFVVIFLELENTVALFFFGMRMRAS